MQINLQNYEAYFIDYIEGKLDTKTIGELKEFLVSHPELQTELEQYTSVSIPTDAIIFNEKPALYKFKFDETPINKNTYNDFCIAYYENILNEEKKAELLRFIETNPEFKNDFLLYKKTYLQPEVVVYKYRKDLYKKQSSETPVIQIYRWGAIAAGLFIIFGLYFGFLNKKGEQHPNVANKQEEAPKNIVKNAEKVPNNKIANRIPIEKRVLHRANKIYYIAEDALENKNISIEKDTNYASLKPLPFQLLVTRNYTSNLSIADVPAYNSIKTVATNNTIADTTDYDLERKKYFLLSFVETSLNQFNKISKTDFADISYKTDRSGKITSYSVKAGFIEIHRSTEKK
jgi:hypothetical protein